MQNSHMRMSTDANSRQKRRQMVSKVWNGLCFGEKFPSKSGNAQLRVDHQSQSPVRRSVKRREVESRRGR